MPKFKRCNLAVALSLVAVMSNGFAYAQQTRMDYFINGKTISKEAYDLFLKGRDYLHANNNADAVEVLKKAAEMMPDLPDVHNNLGIALAKTGQSAQAIQELQTALNLNPALDASWLSLGGIYQSTGQLDKSIETYKGFLSRFPQHRDAKKVAAIVSGLTEERLRQKTLYPNGESSLQNDYFVEVSQAGVIHWNRQMMPLKVFISPGEGVAGYRPKFGEILQQSFESWSAVSKGLVSFTMVERADLADIVCVWSNDPAKFKNIAEAGHAVLDSSQKRGLIKGTITLLTLPLVDQVPVTDNRMRRTCLHEIGHVLGLAGHSSNPDDAMFHTMALADVWKDLSERDANTIIRLYSQP